MWIIALGFIKNNWKIFAIGIAILSLLGYIGFLRWDARHWKTKYEDAQLVIVKAQQREALQDAANAAITRKYENLQGTYQVAVKAYYTALDERIKNDKELASLRISSNLVRLFNESKHDPQPNSTSAVTVDAQEAPASTGTTLFTTIASNDRNHWECIHQVEDWQNFWRDYEASVKQNNN